MSSELSSFGIRPGYQEAVFVSPTSEPTPVEIGVMAKKKLEEIESLLPFKRHDNPCAYEAQKESIKWIRDQQLITDETKLEEFNKQNFGLFAANCYPDADLETCLPEVLLISWLFIADDSNEKSTDGDALTALFTYFKQVIDNPKSTDTIDANAFSKLSDNPEKSVTLGLCLIRSLADIIERFDRVCTKEWKTRSSGHFKDYLDSSVWELNNKNYKTMPTIADYKRERPATSATIVTHDFIEHVKKIDLPKEVYEHPVFQRLRILAVDITNFENDLRSLKKEVEAAIKEGTDIVHNLVCVIKHEYRIPYKEAIEEASKHLLDAIGEFDRLAADMPDFGEESNKQVQAIISGYRMWNAAHHCWAASARRYNKPTPEVKQ